MKSDLHQLPYRQCVGIALFNEDGKVFVGERIDTPGAWQMPQGGIDQNEDLEKAFYRELKEEVGTDQATILTIHAETFKYDLPPHLLNKLWKGKYRGQEQHWIAARFQGKDSDINIQADTNPEFRDWQWIHFADILDLIVPFKRDTYKKVIRVFRHYSLED